MLVLKDSDTKWEYAEELNERYGGKFAFIASKSNGENFFGVLAPAKSLCKNPGADKISFCAICFGNLHGPDASLPLYVFWHMGGDENRAQGVGKAVGE